MSEIRINIIDDSQTISGTMHGSFGNILVAALAAEPETVGELETATERFVERESDWSFFRAFRQGENFEAWDAGLLVIDLAAKIVMADSTYSYFGARGTVRIKTDEGDDFDLPYRLSGDWKRVGSMPELHYSQTKRRAELSGNRPFESREILFGKPLFEFIAAEYAANKNATNEDLFADIHAKWLMSVRDDLRGKTPREILLEKQDFIDADLHSRFLQWSLTKRQPPALLQNTGAFRFAGFGRHEIVVYYDLFRFLLGECFAKDLANVDALAQIAEVWLKNPSADFSGRIPAKIIEAERRRINLTAEIHECAVDDDCEMCEMLALNFIDTPMFWGLDGSQMEDDRFEFSFEKTLADWEAEQRRMEEFNREFNEKRRLNSIDDAFNDDLLF